MASDEMLRKLISKLNIACDEVTVRLYGSQSGALRNLLISSGVDPENEKEYDESKDELIKLFSDIISSKMFNIVKAAYQNEFTDEEIEKLLIVMDDPLYQKFKAIAESLPLKIIENLLNQFDQIFNEAFKQFKEQIMNRHRFCPEEQDKKIH